MKRGTIPQHVLDGETASGGGTGFVSEITCPSGSAAARLFGRGAGETKLVVTIFRPLDL